MKKHLRFANPRNSKMVSHAALPTGCGSRLRPSAGRCTQTQRKGDRQIQREMCVSATILPRRSVKVGAMLLP